MQTFLTALTGLEAETAQYRLVLLRAYEQATTALSRLDQAVFGHPYADLWRAYDEVYALAELGRQIDEPAEPKRIFSALAGSENNVLDPAIGRQSAAARQRWRSMERRKEHDALKALVDQLCSVKAADTPSLLTLIAKLHQLERERIDRTDLIMAIPYALRRLKITRTLLPSLVGTVRVFASRELQHGEMIERFFLRLTAQAEQGLRLLDDVSRAVAESQRKIEGAKTQRKSPLRRLAWEALWPRPLSPAGLARRWAQEVSTTSRLLKSGDELGLILPVADRSTMRRPIYQRFTGVLLAQQAGLDPVPRGRPTSAPHPARLEPLFDEVAFQDALADVDRMLERLGSREPVTEE